MASGGGADWSCSASERRVTHLPSSLLVKKFFELKKPEGAETEEGWLWDIKWRE